MISNKERDEINLMIADVERKSSSELVPMIVKSSDIYPAAHFRCAIVVSFLFSLILYFSPLRIINPIYFLWIQIPGLLLGYYLGNIPAITRIFITKMEIESEVTQRAIEAFFQNNLHDTEKHNGVLIFISLLEKKIKIITDTGVKKKIDQKIWDEIVDGFTSKVTQATLVDALKDTILASSNVLENYFPAEKTAGKNELKNELIIE